MSSERKNSVRAVTAYGPRWRYSIHPEPPARPGEATPFGQMLDNAWRELLLAHMPFRLVGDDERARLLDAFRELEHIFFETTDTAIKEYYQETYIGPPDDEKDVADLASLRHIVLLQSQLMEQAFFALTLNRYGNAPANRGWMNLFRRWGATKTFNMWFDEYRALFSRQFVAFYDNYIRLYKRTIDIEPMPHAWDTPPQLDRSLPPEDEEDKWRQKHWAAAGLQKPDRSRAIPGIFLDSGIVGTSVDALTGEGADPRPNLPSAEQAAPSATDSPTRSEQPPNT